MNAPASAMSVEDLALSVARHAYAREFSSRHEPSVARLVDDVALTLVEQLRERGDLPASPCADDCASRIYLWDCNCGPKGVPQ